MALNDIVFIKGQGGLSKPLTGSDYISGLVFYSGALPSGFSTGTRIKKFLALSDAVNAGISNTYTDETRATSLVTLTTVGATGNVIGISVVVPGALAPATFILASYAQLSTDTTVTILAASIAAAINLNTVVTGFTAISAAGAITISAQPGLGINLNTGTPLVVSFGGTITGTIAQFSGGVGSKLAVMYYHISEYFRMQPKGQLFVGVFAVPGSYTFAEIATMQNFAVGAIRQIGIFKDLAAFALGDVQLISAACSAMDAQHMPISAVYSGDLSLVTDISTLTDLSILASNKCSVVISQDGAAAGAALFLAYGKSIGNIGALLGTISLAPVSQDIAWVQAFNIDNGVENDVLAFANGEAFTDVRVTQGLLNNLNTLRYIFLRKFVGVVGSYWNDSHTAISTTSDYAFIENNRTIDKAIRGIYASLLPSLNSSIQLNADGTISNLTVAYLTSQASINVDQMVRDKDLSGFQIAINATQNVLSSGQLIVAVKLLQKGIARNIIVPIGYNTKLS